MLTPSDLRVRREALAAQRSSGLVRVSAAAVQPNSQPILHPIRRHQADPAVIRPLGVTVEVEPLRQLDV